MCNFVSYFVCVILCIFVFLCDILLPSGVINDDKVVLRHNVECTHRAQPQPRLSRWPINLKVLSSDIEVLVFIASVSL